MFHGVQSPCQAPTGWGRSTSVSPRISRASPSRSRAVSDLRPDCQSTMVCQIGSSRSGRESSANAPWNRDISFTGTAYWRLGRCRNEVWTDVIATTDLPSQVPACSRRGTSNSSGSWASPSLRRPAASACTSSSVTGVTPIFTNARLRPRASKTCSTGLRFARAVPRPMLRSTGSPNTSPRWLRSEPARSSTVIRSGNGAYARPRSSAETPSRLTVSGAESAELKRSMAREAATGLPAGTRMRGTASWGAPAARPRPWTANDLSRDPFGVAAQVRLATGPAHMTRRCR